MVELVRGLEYEYNGLKILKGQQRRFQDDIEEYLVGTGAFEYVGARKVMFINPSITTDISIKNKVYHLENDVPQEFPQSVGFDIIRFGFGTEIPLRDVILKDTTRLKETLFIRNGGFGDLIMLYGALNNLFSTKRDLPRINLMTEKRYYNIFENDPRIILYPLDEYNRLAGRFKHVLDLRMTVEGDPNTHDINRMLLFIRLLGMDINNKNPNEFFHQTRISIPEIKTPFDKHIKKNTLILNISSSRPERNLSKLTIDSLINQLVECKYVDNIILINDLPYRCKNNTSEKVVNLTSMTSLGEVIQLINKSKYYIGLDTGPSHLACALGKLSLIVGGPIDLNLRFTQYESASILQREMDCISEHTCYDCRKRPNPNLPGRCMEFSGEEVYNRFIQIVKNSKKWRF